MPIYEYQCECGLITEVIASQPAEPKCKRCGRPMKIKVSGQARTPGGWA